MDFIAVAFICIFCYIIKIAVVRVYRWIWGRNLKQTYIDLANGELHRLDQHIDDDLDLEDVVETSLDGKKKVKHGLYKSYLVQKGKAQFGTPKRSAANLLVVRKFLHDVCKESGLRARHINQHLDIATEMVFIPTKSELTALAIAHTNRSLVHNELKRELGCVQTDIA